MPNNAIVQRILKDYSFVPWYWESALDVVGSCSDSQGKLHMSKNNIKTFETAAYHTGA